MALPGRLADCELHSWRRPEIRAEIPGSTIFFTALQHSDNISLYNCRGKPWCVHIDIHFYTQATIARFYFFVLFLHTSISIYRYFYLRLSTIMSTLHIIMLLLRFLALIFRPFKSRASPRRLRMLRGFRMPTIDPRIKFAVHSNQLNYSSIHSLACFITIKRNRFHSNYHRISINRGYIVTLKKKKKKIFGSV